MVKNSRRRCKRQGVFARERMSALRLTQKDALNPMRLAQRLIVVFAWRCIYRTSLFPRHIPTEANTAPIAEGQKLVLLH